MANSPFKAVFFGSFWGVVSKLFDAFSKFATIPLLVGYYGKANYGLIALAFALNAYLRLMDMGLNVGSIRFFSVWIANKEWQKVKQVSQSSLVFYGSIGLLNAFIFLVCAKFPKEILGIDVELVESFKSLMYILAASAIFNWTSNVLFQLLNAHGQVGWVNRITLISSVLNLASAFIAVKAELSLPFYFLLYTISSLIVIPFYISRLQIFPILRTNLLTPRWSGQAFKVILKYSLAIFAMGIFQFTANNLRPLLLMHFASKGIEVLTEYRVLQTITMVVMAFGTVFMQALLPSTSKLLAENDTNRINKIIYEGTKYISIFLCFVVFLMIVNSDLLLRLYMGSSYVALSPWLILWLLTVLLSLHNSPIASLVLSTGKTRFLVYSSAISCIVSLPVTIIFAERYNVGAAVIGYFGYVVLQMGMYYFYYTPKVLKLSSERILISSVGPALISGVLSWTITRYLLSFVNMNNGIIELLFTSLIFAIFYLMFILLFAIRLAEIKSLSKMFSFQN